MPIRLGEKAPNFNAQTTEGDINFYDWAGDKWIIFFSHPSDFTPVCTTELGRTAALQEEFEKRSAKAIAISVDDLESHMGWLKDIEETQGVNMNFPIIADPTKEIAIAYDMMHPEADAKFTVRSVFIIDPNRKVRLTLTYPPSTGRNFNEILRVLDSLQLTDNYSVATPVDWKEGEDVVVSPSISTDDIPNKFPKGHKVIKPYLRTTPQPNR